MKFPPKSYYRTMVEEVFKTYQMSRCLPLQAIDKCVKHVMKVHKLHPDGEIRQLPYVAKAYLILLNNTQYYVDKRK